MYLTHEQARIVNAAQKTAEDGRRLKIVAGAGTGKTTTLIAVAHRLKNHNRSVLYLAYNRAIADESREKFKGLAEVFTLHGLAHKMLDVNRNKKGRDIGSIYPSAAIQALSIPGSLHGQRDMWLARGILSTLQTFYISADSRVLRSHVPAHVTKAMQEKGLDWLVTASQALFDMAAPGKATGLRIPHDLYLKTWQVRGNPGLEKYDSVLLDEAQDANPVIVNALAAAKHAVFVGDEHQAIYVFRGAVNAMQMLDGVELPLTRSFRWGPEVAAVANGILAHKRKPPKWELTGDPQRTTKIGKVDSSKQFAGVYRTNNELVEAAVGYCNMAEDKKLALVGDRSDLLDSLNSAFALRAGNMRLVNHHLLRQYKSWDEVLDNTDAGGAAPHIYELRELVRLTDKYENEKLRSDLIKVLTMNKDVKDGEAEAAADIIFTTAHRSKGREWDQVKISDDFDRVYGRIENPDDRELELNLMYVAATRARATLDIKSDVINSMVVDGR